jgi:hypothetical protein
MGLLQLKQLGRLPDELLDQVRPVIEMRDWYMTARRVFTEGLFNGASGGVQLGIGALPGNYTITAPVNGALAQVPNGEVWWCDSMHLFGTLGAAADTIRFACGLEQVSPAPFDAVQVGEMYQDTVTARVNRRVYARSADPFWAFAGDVFLAMVPDLVLTVSMTLTMSLRATRLQL